MQRAVSFLSGFLSEFDIEDPDHNLAGFSTDDQEAPARPHAGPPRDEGGRTCRSRVCDEAASTASDDDVFAPDCLAKPGQWESLGGDLQDCEQGEERPWSTDSHRHSDIQAMEKGRDSPCTTTASVHGDDAQQQVPSTRSMGTIDDTAPRGTWLAWLKQRWSPLKEDNLEAMMRADRSASQGLLERYLTEQTYMHEVAQAELIKRENQLEGAKQSLDLSHDLSSAGVNPQMAVSICGEEQEDGEDEEVLSNNGGDTSQSDGDDTKVRRPSGMTLSEASTARKQSKTDSPMHPEATRGDRRASFFGMRKSVAVIQSHHVSPADMDGLEELWQASDAYANSWASPVPRSNSAGCKQQ